MHKLLAIFAILVPAITQAETSYWDYRDWRVIVETADTGQDLRVHCTALTGGDGDPTLKIQISNGDALPPAHYPAPTLYENAVRGYQTQMQDGQRVLFEFDSGQLMSGFATSGFDEQGFAWAQARTDDAANLWLMQNMRKATTLRMTANGQVIYRASLNGFTAAYGKIAEQCGFPTIGVIE